MREIYTSEITAAFRDRAIRANTGLGETITVGVRQGYQEAVKQICPQRPCTAAGGSHQALASEKHSSRFVSPVPLACCLAPARKA